MRITDMEFHITSILDVKKGRIPPSSPRCNGRYSDCFVYVLSGSAEYTFGEKTIMAQSGNVIYLAHNSQYSIRVTDENYTYIFVDFFFENRTAGIRANEIYTSKSIENLKNHFETIYRLWKTGNFSDKVYCQSIIYAIYSEVIKSSFAQYVSHDKRKQIEKSVIYIHDNLSNSDLTVKQLSKMCGISEVHFRRLFSYIYHTSPVKFITAARINRAKELLVIESGTISEISKICGFENQYYFSKVFKNETNMTPSQFKNFYKANV